MIERAIRYSAWEARARLSACLGEERRDTFV